MTDDNTTAKTVTEAREEQLTIRRTVDAPRDRVWRAFTDPDELEQWFVPDGMTAEVRANELEANGEMIISWIGDDQRIDNEGYYVEVVEPERLVSGEETEDGELRVTYEFRDVDGGTEIVITQEFPESVPDGAAEGWAGMLDQLVELLEAADPVVESTDTSLTIRRTFDAPIERVWRAFTDPDEMGRWYGADLMAVEIHALEVEPGGSFSITMNEGDSTYDIDGEFLEVVEPKRLVHTWYVGRITVELDAIGGKTGLVFTHTDLPDRETTEQHVEGWTAAIETLATTVRDSDAGFDPSEYDLTITRTFDAPREAVWAAWVDPDQVAAWWGPEGFTVPRCELDVRPGGSFHVDMEAPDGTIYPNAGEILEVDEPERLVLRSHVFEDEDGEPQLVTQSTITFDADGTRTYLTLETAVIEATPIVEEALSGMEAGWTGSFEKLEEHLEA
ncbi:SRPBCC family protein [Natronosalvus vescus]|uniref:SRPBCC family protein n=1 Tax=Natronosalvus vescus TaxID=2953881 RepID=UPI002090860F|nr:SRPBCC domain-containing protein [Natronosalvus vescus]